MAGRAAATPAAARWRGKFLWNLRVARLLLVEVSTAEAGCVGSIPETPLTGSDLRERFQHLLGKMNFMVQLAP